MKSGQQNILKTSWSGILYYKPMNSHCLMNSDLFRSVLCALHLDAPYYKKSDEDVELVIWLSLSSDHFLLGVGLNSFPPIGGLRGLIQPMKQFRIK